MRRYNFRKPKRKGGPSEQVDMISISDYEDELQKDNLQQEQVPLHQEEPTQEKIPKRVHIPSKKCRKRTSQQAMAAHMRGKKVQTYQDDEVRYVFIPTYQSYNSNMNNILLWTSSREEERAWANITRLVGLFDIDQNTLETTFSLIFEQLEVGS